MSSNQNIKSRHRSPNRERKRWIYFDHDFTAKRKTCPLFPPIDKDGNVHRFSRESNGQTHWSGSTATERGIHKDKMPSKETLRQLEELLKK